MKEKGEGPARRGGTAKKIVWAAVALAAAVVVFLAGYFTYYATLPDGAKSLLWMKSEIDANYYYGVDEDDFWDAALDGASGVLDDYSGYYSEEEYDARQSDYAGSMVGVGLNFFSGTNLISRVAIGSPVFLAGGGEKIVQEGMYLTGAGESEESLAVIDDYSSAAEAFADFAEGDTVCMRFSAENSADAADSFTLTVTYSAYTESFLLYAYGGKAYAYLYDEDGGAHWSDVSEHVTQDETAAGADGVAYIRLVRFAGDAAEAFARAAVQYREDGAETLFLDLRNNGGGLMSVLEEISAYLLRNADSDNEIIQTARYKSGSETRFPRGGQLFCGLLRRQCRVRCREREQRVCVRGAHRRDVQLRDDLLCGYFPDQDRGLHCKDVRQGHHADDVHERRRGGHADDRADLLAERHLHPRQGHHGERFRCGRQPADGRRRKQCGLRQRRARADARRGRGVAGAERAEEKIGKKRRCARNFPRAAPFAVQGGASPRRALCCASVFCGETCPPSAAEVTA